MSIAIVRQHLVDTLRTATGDMTLVLEGENFQPTGLQDYPFGRFQILPRESVLLDISTNYTMQEAGLAAITIYFSRSTNTVTDALVLAEMIKAVFPIQNVLLDGGNQFIVQASWIEGIRHEENVFGVPIFIRWLNVS